MTLKNWREVIDTDWPDIGPITRQTVENNQKYSQRYSSDARLATGRIWTDEAYELRRQKVLSTPLP